MQPVNVPYEERQMAKQLGMCFDYSTRKWYYMRDNPNIDEILMKWSTSKTCVFTDEGIDDDGVRPPWKLRIQLIPRNMHSKNLRNQISRDDWDVVRKACYARAGFRCEGCDTGREACGGLECHEEFTYDDSREECKLTRFVALCSTCHKCVHYGYGVSAGKQSMMDENLMNICGWDREQLAHEIYTAYELVEEMEKKRYPLVINSVMLR